jgi:hypothetical protein
MRKTRKASAAAPIAGAAVSWLRRLSSRPRTRAGAIRRSAYAIAAVLIAAAIVSLLSLFSPQVQASAPEDAMVEINAPKGDRLDFQRLGTDCSPREWPYFTAACLRNARNWAAPVRQPRMVSVDRLIPQDAGATAPVH